MTKIPRLNDLQLVLLSTASQRADGRLLPVPDSVTADPKRVQAALTLLIRRKLAAKTRGGNPITITDAGRAAIGVGEPKPADLASTNKIAAAGDTIATDAGGHTQPEPDTTSVTRSSSPSPVKITVPNGAPIRVDASCAIETGAAPDGFTMTTPLPPFPSNKTALVLSLLQREGGATLDKMVAATGWLPHTARAALSGLRKGHAITKDKRGKTTCYRIAVEA